MAPALDQKGRQGKDCEHLGIPPQDSFTPNEGMNKEISWIISLMPNINIFLSQNYLFMKTKDKACHKVYRAVYFDWYFKTKLFQSPAPIWPDNTDAVNYKKFPILWLFMKSCHLSCRSATLTWQSTTRLGKQLLRRIQEWRLLCSKIPEISIK